MLGVNLCLSDADYIFQGSRPCLLKQGSLVMKRVKEV